MGGLHSVYFKGIHLTIDVAVTDATLFIWPGRHITIHLRLFKYDAELKWPSVMRLQLTLFESNPDHHSETTWTVNPVNNFYGIFRDNFYETISDSTMKFLYIRDSMLSYRVSLELDDQKP